MSLEAEVRQAIREELERQAENGGPALKVERRGDGIVVVNGPVDADGLVTVVLGSVAGGP